MCSSSEGSSEGEFLQRSLVYLQGFDFCYKGSSPGVDSVAAGLQRTTVATVIIFEAFLSTATTGTQICEFHRGRLSFGLLPDPGKSEFLPVCGTCIEPPFGCFVYLLECALQEASCRDSFMPVSGEKMAT